MPEWTENARVWAEATDVRLEELASCIAEDTARLEIVEAKLDADDVRINLLIKRVEALEKSPPTPGPSPEPPPPPDPSLDYGPRFPVGPQKDVSIPTPYVSIYPGDNVVKIYSEPAGTIFAFEPGVHYYPSAIWLGKDGFQFWGKPGAILDGQNIATAAFNTGAAKPAKDTVIANLTIQNYVSSATTGAILGYKAEGWQILNCEICNNASAGISVSTGSVLIARNHVHHNGRVGITGSLGVGGIIEDNYIHDNNPDEKFPLEGATAASGGAKFTLNENLTIRYNRSENNHGVGLWTDIDCIGTLYERNHCIDNAMEGIFHEISYEATIRENLLENNGHSHGWFYGGGITIGHSRDVEVYNNVLRGNRCGITGTDQCRGSGAYGEYRLQNVYIHGNTIEMLHGKPGTWAAGFATTCGRPVYSSANQYEGNHYRLFSSSLFADQNQKAVSWLDWQQMNQDREGTCSVTY